MSLIRAACLNSEQHMRPVAIRRVAGVLAAAKQRKLGALGREHQGLDSGAGMRPVAKWLFLTAPAAAPGIALPGLELDLVRAELRSLRL